MNALAHWIAEAICAAIILTVAGLAFRELARWCDRRLRAHVAAALANYDDRLDPYDDDQPDDVAYVNRLAAGLRGDK